MENALALFGLAAALAAGALTIRVVADWWFRAKQLERGEGHPAADAAALAGVEERLARIEQALEAAAVDIERIAEAQRFTTKLLAEQRPTHGLLTDGHGTHSPSE